MEFLVNIDLWERAYIDLWSIPHFFFGFLSFYLLLKINLKKSSSFIIVIIFAILWEFIEYFTPVQEYVTNIITDVVLAGVGFLFAGFIKIIKPNNDSLIIKISTFIFVISGLLGYTASFIRNFL
jgi:hypothetical protein